MTMNLEILTSTKKRKKRKKNKTNYFKIYPCACFLTHENFYFGELKILLTETKTNKQKKYIIGETI